MTSEVKPELRSIETVLSLTRYAKTALRQAGVSAARVVSSAGKKLSMRNSCRPTSRALAKVVSVENNRSVELFHL